MQGYYSDHGNGWRLATSLMVLATELTIKYPSVTCLGTMGDASHAAQGTSTDHMPWVIDPDGIGVVRAIDIGGPPEVQQAIFNRLKDLYALHDPRLYFYGYIHKDGVITNWSTDNGVHDNPGDDGHVHVSVTQANGGNPVMGRSGYVPAIDSPLPWGFLPGGHLGQDAGAAPLLPPPKGIVMAESFRTCSGPDKVKYAFTYSGAWWSVGKYDSYVVTLPGYDGHAYLSQGQFDALKMIVASTRRAL